jgi:hypothetical protein
MAFIRHRAGFRTKINLKVAPCRKNKMTQSSLFSPPLSFVASWLDAFLVLVIAS